MKGCLQHSYAELKGGLLRSPWLQQAPCGAVCMSIGFCDLLPLRFWSSEGWERGGHTPFPGCFLGGSPMLCSDPAGPVYAENCTSPCLSGLSYCHSRSHCPNRIPKITCNCFKHGIALLLSNNTAAKFGDRIPSLISRSYLIC